MTRAQRRLALRQVESLRNPMASTLAAAAFRRRVEPKRRPSDEILRPKHRKRIDTADG